MIIYGKLQHSVNLVSFEEGKIQLRLNDSIEPNFVREVSNKLSKWTGKNWIVEASKEVGDKSLVEQQKDAFENEKDEVFRDKMIFSIKERFPSAEIVKIEKFACNSEE